jgi:hypothetical protein
MMIVHVCLKLWKPVLRSFGLVLVPGLILTIVKIVKNKSVDLYVALVLLNARLVQIISELPTAEVAIHERLRPLPRLESLLNNALKLCTMSTES